MSKYETNWTRWTRRLTQVSVVALVAAIMVGTGASPLLDGHDAAAKKRARSAATSLDVAALKIERFSNTTPIAIAGNRQTAPSTIVVSGLQTSIADVNVSLNVLTDPTAGNLDVLLVGPGGQTAMIMSDATGPAENDSLVLDDQAANQLPIDLEPYTSGTFQPTNYDFVLAPDIFAAPAPTNPSKNPQLAVFNGTDPNGTWTLFIRNQGPQAGSLGGGWGLTITAANGVPTANPDRFQAQADTPLTIPADGVLGNDSDPDGDALTAVLAGQPRQGSAQLQADGGFTYIPNKKAKGTDSFTYLAQDATGLRDLGTVDIQITKAKKHKHGKGKK